MPCPAATGPCLIEMADLPSSIDPKLGKEVMAQLRKQMELKLTGLLTEFFEAVGTDLEKAAERASRRAPIHPVDQ